METLKMETSIKGNNGTAKGTFELQDWIQTEGISYYHFTPLMQLQNWTLYPFVLGMCAIGSCFFICIYPISLFQMQHCRTEAFQVHQTVS
jgi:hypothetical protein